MTGVKILVLGLEAELNFINQALAMLFKHKSMRGKLGPVVVDVELPPDELLKKFDWILIGGSRASLVVNNDSVDLNRVMLFANGDIEEFASKFPNLIKMSQSGEEDAADKIGKCIQAI